MQMGTAAATPVPRRHPRTQLLCCSRVLIVLLWMRIRQQGQTVLS